VVDDFELILFAIMDSMVHRLRMDGRRRQRWIGVATATVVADHGADDGCVESS
jgi:hypothetical protein